MCALASATLVCASQGLAQSNRDLSLPGVAVPVRLAGANLALDPLFRSQRDENHELNFEISGKNDPASLISQARISNGQLVIQPKPGAAGTASLTVRASFKKKFSLYDNISGTVGVNKPDTIQAGMEKSQILYHYHFFDKDPLTNKHEAPRISEERLRGFLLKDINSVDNLVLDIEHDRYFGNNPSGLANLANVLSFVRKVRPDVKNLGYYGVVPEKNWWEPVRYRRGQRDKERKVTTTYTYNSPTFTAAYNAWRNANNQVRNEVFTSASGQPESFVDRLSAVYPVVYSRYRDFNDPIGALIPITADIANGTFSAQSCGFANDSVVSLIPTDGTALPPPLTRTDAYRVVGSSPNQLTFQLQNSVTNEIVRITKPFAAQVYAHRVNTGRTLCQDQDVQDWHFYAEENINEARRVAPGKPIIAFMSPSYNGDGEKEVEGEFWRNQLRVVRNLADGAIVWDYYLQSHHQMLTSAWWRETQAFLESLRPRTITFTLSIGPNANTSSQTTLPAPRNLVIVPN